MEPPNTLMFDLRPHQKQTLYWMSKLEKRNDVEEAQKTSSSDILFLYWVVSLNYTGLMAFFIEVHCNKQRNKTIVYKAQKLRDAIMSVKIELASLEVTACSQGSLFLPSTIMEEIFSLELPNERLIGSANFLSPFYTLVQLICQDHNGLIYDVMRTLKDYNIQV